MLFRRVRRAVLVAVVAGGGVFATASSASAGSGGAPSLVLLGQSTTVTPATIGQPAPFVVNLEVKGAAPTGDEVGLTFYRKLGTRSAFEQTLTTPPSGILETVTPQPLAGLKTLAGGGFQVTTPVLDGSRRASGSGVVGLNCSPGGGLCSGVYPVVVQLLQSDDTVVSHFTTYLTYAETKASSPLVFSWVAPIAAPVRVRTSGSLAGAVSPIGSTRIRHLDQLVTALNQNPLVQTTVAASPATVDRLEASHSVAADGVLAGLRSLAGLAPHRLIVQPYVPVNLSALAGAGITTEIRGQMVGGEGVFEQLLGKPLAADVPSRTWLDTGPVGPAIGQGLDVAGAERLVLPDTDLANATDEDHATWSQPFKLSVGSGPEITAATSDTQLSSRLDANPHDPALSAYQFLAELAMIHFEIPGVQSARGIIAVPPNNWDPDPQFVDALVEGLANNPVVTTTTLDGFFAAVSAGVNGASPTRRLAAGTDGQRISHGEAASIVSAREQITGFANAVPGDSPVKSQLESLLLASESSELSAEAQRDGIASFERHLAGELDGIKVVQSTVTLTARTASIPITIVSSTNYALKATLTLSSAKLQFPGGATKKLVLDHPTNSTTIEVRARTTGDLPLRFTLTSPDKRLVIAQGQLTVRSTATSIVGIVLTLVAAVVLLGWWARTWRRGRRRKARSLRGAPS